LGIGGLEVIDDSFEAGNLLGSSGCPVQRIEYQHYVFLPFELAQGKLGSTQVTRQLEIGRLLTNSDHVLFSFIETILGAFLNAHFKYKGRRRIFNALCKIIEACAAGEESLNRKSPVALFTTGLWRS
jgi:hypothetical protein